MARPQSRHTVCYVGESTEITQLQEISVHENPWWTVYFDEVRFPSGRHGRHLRLRATSEKPGAVVLAVRRNRDAIEVALVRSYRYAQQCMMWEAPRGFAEGSDPDTRTTAVRELAEEAGLQPERVLELGHLTTDSSIVEGEVAAFLVVTPDGTDGACDGDETDALRWISWEELQTSVRNAEIRVGFTLGALGLLAAHGGVVAAIHAATH